MPNNQLPFRKNKLVLAMGLALIGTAMSGCTSDDDTDDDSSGVAISINGGLGGNGYYTAGGDGGELYIYNRGSTGGIEIRKEGKAPTAFTSPELPSTTDTGSNPLAITADTTLISVTPVQFSRTADTTGSFAIGQVYMGSDDVLRTSAAGGAADYAADTLVTDNTMMYRSTSVPNELFQAVGDDTTADLAPAGTLYRNGYIYIADGDDTTGDSYYTGLSVAENATLTVADNNGCDATLSFPEGIANNGTIKAETNDCSLNIYTDTSYIGTGTVTTAGDDTAPDGGEIYISADNSIDNKGIITASGYTSTDDDGGDGGEIYLYADAYIVNTGEISSKGGDGFNDGGYAGGIFTNSPIYTENSGVLNVDGGSSTGTGNDMGSGRPGGYIGFYADTVLAIKSSSTVTANGGDGTRGGDGGEIYFDTNDDQGFLVNGADLNANGGIGNTSSGGRGGSIYISSDGGDILSSGDINAEGSDTLSTSGYDAGSGGYISFYADYDSSAEGPGDITISGTLNANGGNTNGTGSGYGGYGGYISIRNTMTSSTSTRDQKISLLGYDAITMNGGDGAEGGHVARYDDAVYIYSSSQYNSNNGDYTSGPIVNEVPISAKGGNTTTSGTSYGRGGDGGEVSIRTSTSSSITTENVSVTNSATINTNGGTGYDGINYEVGGGRGGDIELRAKDEVNNSANLTANGGTGGTDGANGGYIDLDSRYKPVTNSASLSATGSNAEFYGGHGGRIDLEGEEVFNSGSLNVNAGNATNATGSFGGDGGEIGLYTNNSLFGINNSGSTSYSFGTGEINGTEGCLYTNLTSQGDGCGIEGGEFFFEEGGKFFFKEESKKN